VILINVMDAAFRALADRTVDEFVLPEERDATTRHRRELSRAMVALHEVVGHGSGKVSESLPGDPSALLKEFGSTLEEARAELVALHHVADSLLVERGVLSSSAAADEAIRSYVRADLIQLRRVVSGDRLEDDHMRATHLIAEFLRREGKCVELRPVGGRHFAVVTDLPRARRTVATLLAEVMRIKAEGDYDAARRLVETYAIRFDPALRDEVVRRCRDAGIPRFFAFHMPALRAVTDGTGAILDVVVDYGKDFDTMMLEWDLQRPAPPID
jgi:dipeptidyl-peptidase-3